MRDSRELRTHAGGQPPCRGVHRFSTALALAVAFGLGAAGAAAQTAADTFVDRVVVPRVLVDLVVETKGGEPVFDLRREEVRVFEDDRPVEILGWSPPVEPRSWQEADPREPRTLEGADDQRPDTFILFLDELHLDPRNKTKLLRQIRPVAQELVESGGQAVVLAWDGNLRLVQPATRDARALVGALETEIRANRVSAQALLASPSNTMRLIEQRMQDNTQERPERSGPAAAPDPNDPCVDVGGIARTHAHQAAAIAERSLDGLIQALATLSRFPGRKSLIHVSDGIPLVPGLEVYTYAMEMCDGTAARQGLPHAVDTQEFGAGKNSRWDPRKARTEAYDFDTTRRWRELTAYANAHQVSLYPIQATGLQGLRSAGAADVRTTTSFAQTADGNVRDSLSLAARQTGGRTFWDSNTFGDGIVAALTDAQSVYELTFAPSTPGDGRVHDIRVEVDRPGVVVRHRRSYRALHPAAELESVVLATLLHGSGDNPLDARVVPSVKAPAEKGVTKALLQVFVPLSRLATIPDSSGDRRGRFTVAVGGRQADGRYLEFGLKGIDVLASEVDVTSQAFLYEIEVPFRSPAITFAVAVRDELGGAVSSLQRDLKTP
ncbi:MAG TPA: VWA domain-containing protein [Thermoanaerobaculia bacterium]|nr:VWA domain-containing protein [Thermoanaerobaculia bacterium]